eukprot:gb/GECH01011710.1/.p1 GENE.gb/GECH01011710.1/~~gb/GECH01011710.1/.p1  ORF type:complete len:322 (+),score=54.75 gb/GECH01011710.1/:1-966(+)
MLPVRVSTSISGKGRSNLMVKSRPLASVQTEGHTFSNGASRFQPLSAADTRRTKASFVGSESLLNGGVNRSSANSKLSCISPLRNSAFSSTGFTGSRAFGQTVNSRISPVRQYSTLSSTSEAELKTPSPKHGYYAPDSKTGTERPLGEHGDPEKRAFVYMMLSGGRFVMATAARLAVLRFLYSLSASADVLALASTEYDVGAIPEGKTVTIQWRGKPVFIRHRTGGEISNEESLNADSLRDPAPDTKRYREGRPEYVVFVGVCTHLGCVPVADAGIVEGGFFCPCHGSHYDTAGRIRKGPAPLNLEIPPYQYTDDKTIVIG